jgi:hypothetical protein
MEEIKFITALTRSVMEISFYAKIIGYYNEFLETIKELKVIDYFIEKKKSEDNKYLEILFFDAKLIHWLCLDSTSIKHTTYPINTINSIFLGIFNDQETLEYNDKPKIDQVHFDITFPGVKENIIIISNTRKYPELLRIKNNLLTIISGK